MISRQVFFAEIYRRVFKFRIEQGWGLDGLLIEHLTIARNMGRAFVEMIPN